MKRCLLLSLLALVIVLCPLTAKADGMNNASYWDTYSSDYYRDKLDKKMQAVYDEMYAQSMTYLTSNADIPTVSVSSSKAVFMPYIDATGLSTDEAKKLIKIFVDANPQFYFLGGTVFAGKTIDGRYYITTDVYKNYIKGEERKKATEIIKSKLDDWVLELHSYSAEAERVQAAYDLVAAFLAYDKTIDSSAEKSAAHQSIATAILTGKSVCAGYAELFEMLCRVAGLDCIVITNDSHEWNAVRIGNYWYNVDVTLDDMGKKAGRAYYCLSDESITKKDKKHAPDGIFNGLKPECSYDFGDAPDDGKTLLTSLKIKQENQ